MGFTRQINLKTAFLLQHRTLRSLIVAFSSLSCGLLIFSTLHAGCGDYVILTGKTPAHLLARHAAEKEMMFHQVPRELNSQNLFVQLFSPQAPQPCHGPNCGQDRSPAMATTVVPIPTDNQINLYCTSDSNSAQNDRAGRYSLVSDTLLASDHHQRIDRPPRV